MDRKLVVTLLRKNIEELEMITEGFMEMNEFPMAIIQLAQRKTEDIQSYIQQLSELKQDKPIAEAIDVVKWEIPTEQQESSVVVQPVAEVLIEKEIQAETPDEIEITKAVEAEEATEALEVVVDDSTEIIEKEEIAETIELIPEKEIVEELVLEPELEIKPIEHEHRRTVLGERIAATPTSRNEMLSKEDNSIGSVLGNKRISDIKTAISIGDRFRFQRELFRSNGEDMNKTLTYINQLATLEEALSFLQSKYGWNSDNETAEDFYQIVRRRFL